MGIQAEKETDLSQVSGNQEWGVCLFPLGHGNTTQERRKLVLAAHGTAQRCLFASSRFLHQSQEEQVLLSAWCLQRCSCQVLPLSRSQTPESRDLKTCVILFHSACSHSLPHALFSLIHELLPSLLLSPFPRYPYNSRSSEVCFF